MRFSLRTTIDRIPWVKVSEWSVIALLLFSVLWKGGKGLETTWLLMGVAWLCTFVYYLTRKSSETKNIDPVLWGSVIVFILWTILSYWHSATQNYGLDEVLRTGALGFLFLWIIRKKDNGRFVERVVWAITVATLIACAVGIAVYVLQPVNRFVGTFFDARFHTDYWPNAWAEYLLLAWPIVVCYVLKGDITSPTVRRRLPRVVPFIPHIIVGLVLAALLLSYSRGALIAFTGQLLLWAFLVKQQLRVQWRKIGLQVLIVALVSFGFFSIINGLRSGIHEVQPVAEKVTFTADEGGSSISERIGFWQQALELSVEKPIYGWGPYSFRFVQPRLQTEILATSDHPHNVFLKLAMERGWIAAVLFAVIVIFVLAQSWRRVAGIGNVQSLLLIAVAGVLAHNLIDYNLQFVGIALPFWLLLGVLAGDLPYTDASKLYKKFVRITEVFLITALMIVAVLEARTLISSSLGRHDETRGEYERALFWYDQSKGQLFSRDLHLSRANILIKEDRLAEAQSAIDDYFSVNAEDGRAWRLRGDIAFLSGKSDQALVAYEHAYKLSRFNDISITNGLLNAYEALDRFREFETRRGEFDALMDQVDAAIQNNTHFITLSPNVEQQIVLAGHFARIYRREAPRYHVLAARADHFARIERGKIAARAPGYLW